MDASRCGSNRPEIVHALCLPRVAPKRMRQEYTAQNKQVSCCRIRHQTIRRILLGTDDATPTDSLKPAIGHTYRSHSIEPRGASLND
jgi:hypothetical protein